FAFIPEANLKVGYRVRENLSLSVGYSFIYFDNVALNGDIVDRVVDGTSLTTGVFSTRPAFDFEDSSLWVQGIDLGMVLNF
ncbi:MAG: BBP7 family outer membrane beta-barrel protein, partial [Pirellulales bacterium]|nr:BBP7 family outer membrane beta-barrel protein [Pirellulales bacterium]